MFRYLTLVWAILIQLCFGAVYAWSTFVVPLKKNYGLSSLQTQIIFGLMIGVFATMMIVTGRLQEKYGPRLVTAFGAVAYGAGYLMASFSNGSFVVLLISMGLITGVGLGLGYISSIVACQKCFPRQKGFVTGLVVAGFGAGAVSIAIFVKPLLDRGLDILQLFRYMGVAYFLIILAGSIFLKIPRAESKASWETIRVRELIGQPVFRTMFLCMFTGTFAGLMIIGNLAPIGISFGAGQTSAVIAISTFAAGNAVGRIIWGKLYDSIGKGTITASLAFMGFSLLCLLLFGSSSMLFPVFAFMIGFSFGANLVLYAAHTADLYGIGLVGSIYPYVSMAYGFSALIGPVFGGFCFDLRNSFVFPLMSAFLLSVCGALLFFLFSKRNKETSLGKTTGTVLEN